MSAPAGAWPQPSWQWMQPTVQQAPIAGQANLWDTIARLATAFADVKLSEQARKQEAMQIIGEASVDPDKWQILRSGPVREYFTRVYGFDPLGYLPKEQPAGTLEQQMQRLQLATEQQKADVAKAEAEATIPRLAWRASVYRQLLGAGPPAPGPGAGAAPPSVTASMFPAFHLTALSLQDVLSGRPRPAPLAPTQGVPQAWQTLSLANALARPATAPVALSPLPFSGRPEAAPQPQPVALPAPGEAAARQPEEAGPPKPAANDIAGWVRYILSGGDVSEVPAATVTALYMADPDLGQAVERGFTMAQGGLNQRNFFAQLDELDGRLMTVVHRVRQTGNVTAEELELLPTVRLYNSLVNIGKQRGWLPPSAATLPEDPDDLIYHFDQSVALMTRTRYQQQQLELAQKRFDEMKRMNDARLAQEEKRWALSRARADATKQERAARIALAESAQRLQLSVAEMRAFQAGVDDVLTLHRDQLSMGLADPNQVMAQAWQEGARRVFLLRQSLGPGIPLPASGEAGGAAGGGLPGLSQSPLVVNLGSTGDSGLAQAFALWAKILGGQGGGQAGQGSQAIINTLDPTQDPYVAQVTHIILAGLKAGKPQQSIASDIQRYADQVLAEQSKSQQIPPGVQLFQPEILDPRSPAWQRAFAIKESLDHLNSPGTQKALASGDPRAVTRAAERIVQIYRRHGIIITAADAIARYRLGWAARGAKQKILPQQRMGAWRGERETIGPPSRRQASAPILGPWGTVLYGTQARL